MVVKRFNKTILVFIVLFAFSPVGSTEQRVEKDYYPKGNIKFVIPYNDEKKEGLCQWYYENGNIKQETPYKNGLRDGIDQWYHPNGKNHKQIQYSQGIINGFYRVYYIDGSLQEETLYKQGKKHGDYKKYSRKGDLLLKIRYKNGFKEISLLFDKNGKPSYRTIYRRGKFVRQERLKATGSMFDALTGKK